MPYPFTLPTTAAFTFSTYFDSPSHPSLPSNTTTQRSLLRTTLKSHKRLPPNQQSQHLPSLLQTLESYLPYLFALDAGLSNRRLPASSNNNNNNNEPEEIDVLLKSTPTFEWRPTLSSPSPLKSLPTTQRTKLQSLEFELYFTLLTYANIHCLLARSALHPLHTTTTAPLSPDHRTAAITTATKHLLTAASVTTYLSNRADALPAPSQSSIPTADIRPSTFRALAALALAEATLLAVLKDDPYPAAVAQQRNIHDKEWMIHAPVIPKVRAHLFARLCLAAAEHAERASALVRQSGDAAAGGRGAGGAKIDDDLFRYVEDLRRVARAKACRFLGIDADLAGSTGTGIAWLKAGMMELGTAVDDSSSSSSSSKKQSSSSSSPSPFSKLKSSLTTKREDRRISQNSTWGLDAGKGDENRVLTMLSAKWTKMNDTMNTQLVPPVGPLLAQMPSGREMHVVKPWTVPVLDGVVLEGMRAPPGGDDDDEDDDDEDEDGDSSEEEGEGKQKRSAVMAGTFPGTSASASALASARVGEGEGYAGSGGYY